MTAISAATPSGTHDIDGLLAGSKWTVSSLTYSFPASAVYYGPFYGGDGEPFNHFGALNSTQQASVRKALGLYSSVANLTFTEITETATVHATLRFAGSAEPSTAWAYYPAVADYGGDVWIGNATAKYDAPAVGNYAYLTFLHEIGHALGLKHAHEDPAVSAGHDSMEYTVMSYRSYKGQSLAGGGYTNGSTSYAQSLMMYDIAAVQHLYGANFSSHAGNNTYSWDPSTGELRIDGVGQGAPAGNRVFMTVWDGGGTDTYDFSLYSTGVSANLNPGAWTTMSSAQLAYLGDGHYAEGNIANALLYHDDQRSMIENATGGWGADTLIGNDIANRLAGNPGNDTISGGGGDDLLYGDAGNDTLDGGAGNDTVFGGAGDDIIFCGFGTDTVYGDSGSDTLSFANAPVGVAAMLTIYRAWDIQTDARLANVWDVENIEGSPYADYLAGNAQANVITGGGGDDTLLGDGGDDTFYGGLGNDVIYGGSGNDTVYYTSGTDVVYADDGSDTLSFANAGMAVAAMLTIYRAWDLFTDARLANAWGVENLEGSSYGDYLAGDAQANVITGGGGDDVLVGGDGDDTLDGGAGNDAIYDGAGNDWVYYTSGTDTIYGDSGSDTLSFAHAAMGVATMLSIYRAWDLHTDARLTNMWNVENAEGSAYSDYLEGDAQANVLTGGAGDDMLVGGAGDDVLVGGAGNDVLTGGPGSDRFDYNRSGDGIDTITDFTASSGGDVLDLRDVLSGFVAGTSNAGDFIQLSASGADTIVRLNADGIGSDFVDAAVLANAAGLLLSDLLANGNVLLA